MPYDTGSYKQTPYEEVDEDEYQELLARMPRDISWDKLAAVQRSAAPELACTAGGGCDCVDIA